MDQDDEHLGDPSCPFCGSRGIAGTWLLVVDKTFRTAEGGLLMSAFNERWSALQEAGGENFDEREPFDSLLEEIDSLADAALDSDHEGGPGMSSSYVTYFASSEAKAKPSRDSPAEPTGARRRIAGGCARSPLVRQSIPLQVLGRGQPRLILGRRF